MKRISIALCLTLLSFLSNAQAIKLSTYSGKYVRNSTGIMISDGVGAPMSSIPQKEFGGATVYWKIDVVNFKAIKAKYRLDVKVYQVKDGQEVFNYKHDMFLPTKNGWAFMYSEFTEGTYIIYITDQDHPEDVYSKATFTVPAIPKVDYKHNSTLVVCKSVDDNWNPIGATTKVKSGECMNFLYKAKDKVPYSVMTWNVVRVNEEGNEDYITSLDQGTTGKAFRWLATDQGICVFNQPGKYYVYLFQKDNYDTQIKRTEESSQYIGKTEITVY
jgi:hypothetical protein